MKFGQRKKAKMRKYNQRRINRNCKYMIGRTIDYEHGYKVKDQCKINDIIYLLVEEENKQFAIYKIVKLFEYVRLSSKRVLQNKEAFLNYANWHDNSTIEFTDEGEIKSVRKTIRKESIKNGKISYEYIVL